MSNSIVTFSVVIAICRGVTVTCAGPLFCGAGAAGGPPSRFVAACGLGDGKLGRPAGALGASDNFQPPSTGVEVTPVVASYIPVTNDGGPAGAGAFGSAGAGFCASDAPRTNRATLF